MSNIYVGTDNSTCSLKKLVNTYNTELSNLNNDYKKKTTILYNDIAQEINPIYIELQSNNAGLDRITSFTNVFNYYSNSGKSNEALQIKTNIGYEWSNLDFSKKKICDFMGVSKNVDNITLISEISSLSQLIPSDLRIPLNNIIIYLNKLEGCSNIAANN